MVRDTIEQQFRSSKNKTVAVDGQATTEFFTVQLVSWEEQQAALKLIRRAVFVEEQAVPEELELDEWDGVSQHVLALDQAKQAIGCGRLLPNGYIGRIAVLARWRGHGVGMAMLETLLNHAQHSKLDELHLHAQLHSLPFYARAGFVAHGPVFEEAGILHQNMTLSLPKTKTAETTTNAASEPKKE